MRLAAAVGVVVVVVPVDRRVAREAEVLRACAVVLVVGRGLDSRVEYSCTVDRGSCWDRRPLQLPVAPRRVLSGAPLHSRPGTCLDRKYLPLAS